MNFLAVSRTSCYFKEVNFSISLFVPEKKEGRKRKNKKNKSNCPPQKKTPPDYFGLFVKDYKSQSKKNN